MWLHYWSLSHNPFLAADPQFVETPIHLEAVSRLVHAIKSEEQTVAIVAPAGLGKTRVLARAFSEARSSSRRLVRLSAAATGNRLAAGLAERLGVRVAGAADAGTAWRLLREALLLCHWQRQAVVAAIDDVHLLWDQTARLELERLAHGGPCPETRLRLVVAGRPVDGGFDWDDRKWLEVRLLALTRGEAAHYLQAKLASAGRTQVAFSPRAFTRLHALAEGVPRAVDRLASVALMAGANQGAQVITAELLEEATREWAAIEV
jgi:type II secretory pathway predicted ATPase ExeA